MPEKFVPPEVTLDHHGRQVLATTSLGHSYAQYVECSEGCGYLIGCGDAIDTVAHESCIVRNAKRVRR